MDAWSRDVQNSLYMYCKAFWLAGGKSRDLSLKFIVDGRHFDFSEIGNYFTKP